MSEAAAKQREELYGLQGVYLDAYNAVVKPHQIVPISYYVLRRWAPMLGGTGFWLLVTLQQECYKKGGNCCSIGRDALAAAAATSPATVHRYLHGEGYVESGLCHWVTLPKSDAKRQWSKPAGRMVQATNRYTVVMDAPLAQIDQCGLAQYLRENGVQPGAPLTEIAPALEHLAALDLDDLLSLLDEHAARFEPPAGWGDTFYPVVADVVAALGVKVGGKASDLARLCSNVQSAITAPTWLATQYFRQRWVPRLGHTLALVVVQLRSCCFWNEKEKRDTVEAYTGDLAHACGCEDDTIRSAYRDEQARLFFEVTSGIQRGRRPNTFRVVLRESIAPEDQAEYELLLSGTLDTETGQIGLPMGGEENPNFEHLDGQQTRILNASEEGNPNSEQGNPNFERLEGQQTRILNASEEGNPNSEQGNPNFEHHVKHSKHSLKQTLAKKQQEHTSPHGNGKTQDTEPSAAAADELLVFLRDQVGIHRDTSLKKAIRLVDEYDYSLPELRAILTELEEREQRGSINNLPGLFMVKLEDGDNPTRHHMRKHYDGDASESWAAFLRGES